MRPAWKITLVAGATAKDVIAFLVVILFAGNIYGFAALMQPFLLSEVLHAPVAIQGRLTGLFNGAQYGGVLIFIGLAGGLADRVGRKAVLIAALIGLTLGLALFPLASSILAMFVLRFFFGAASTGYSAGSAALMIDFPQNPSRGKFISLMLAAQGVASIGLLGWVLPHLPAWLKAAGFDAVSSTRYPFWGLAAVGLCGAAFAIVFFHPPRNALLQEGASAVSVRRLLAQTARVWTAGRENPRFGLVILIGFVIRADLYVYLSFLTLWVTTGARAHGLDAAVALQTIGVLVATYQLITIVAPPIFGILADRINRMNMLIGSLFVSSLAFASTILVTDVTGWTLIAVTAGIGITDMAQSVASQVVLGEETPADLRGSAMGVFFMVGTLSVILVSYVGGILFDKFSHLAPFFLLAGLNIGFAALAIAVLARARRR